MSSTKTLQSQDKYNDIYKSIIAYQNNFKWLSWNVEEEIDAILEQIV